MTPCVYILAALQKASVFSKSSYDKSLYLLAWLQSYVKVELFDEGILVGC